jgi:hypothetical protein
MASSLTSWPEGRSREMTAHPLIDDVRTQVLTQVPAQVPLVVPANGHVGLSGHRRGLDARHDGISRGGQRRHISRHISRGH